MAPLREIILIWLRDKSETTRVSYRSTVEKFLEFIGNKSLAEVMLEDLQQSLGHASVTTTERYLHISPDAGSSQFIECDSFS